jgi:HlyD family secretion protein
MANAKSKSKTWKKVVVVVVLLAISAGVGYNYFSKKEIPVAVQKEKAARRSLTEVVEANGKVQPVLQVKISPEVSGEIIELPFKEGQRVKKGDLLVKIKPDNYIASRDSQKANYEYSLTSLTTATASCEKAELEFKRNEQLHNEKLVSDSIYQEAKTAYDVAKSSLAGARQQVWMAQASLSKAEDDLSKTTIVSPLDGTLIKLSSQLGERVVGTAMMAGTDIMIVADLNEMEARVEIGENDVVLIQVGQRVRLEVDAFKDSKFNGVVTDVANSAKSLLSASSAASSSSQEATKFEVRIRIAEKDNFRPGMSCTAKIETRYRTNVLTVPIQSVTTRVLAPKTNAVAVTTDSQSASAKATNQAVAISNVSGATATNETRRKSESDKAVEVVFVVDGDKVKARPVKRGISDDAYMEITEGLSEGEEIISGGYKAIARELEDGKAIVIDTTGAEAGKDKK